MTHSESTINTLVCSDLSAGWGESEVLSGISLSLPAGETLAILGRNGVGKTTFLSTIIGRATHRGGSILFNGTVIDKLPSHARNRLGIGFVPQEREIFPSLSVSENLLVAARPAKGLSTEWDLQRVYDLFPRLHERRNNRGNQLSGGEQQMLSIGRALMGNPSLLMMDEPMEGLAPVIVDHIVKAVHRIRHESKLTVMLVEQHLEIAREFTEKIVVLDRGMIVFDNSREDRVVDKHIIESLIAVA